MERIRFQIRNQQHRNYLTIGVHIIAWFLILYLPLLSSSNPPENTREYIIRSVPPLSSALIFYVNYLLLIPRFLFPKKTWLFVVINLVLYGMVLTLLELSRMYFGSPEHANQPVSMEFMIRFFVSFVSTTGVAVAIRMTWQWLRSESLRKDLEREHLKSELVNLKNQLNPHFFFNTLNTIYGLIIQDQDKAQDAVHRLSKLMRYLLYDSNEKVVPLAKEIDFMHHYIDLMRLRSSENLQIAYDFPQVGHEVMIAPLLFISLIENAFKHGVSSDARSEILIRMELQEHKKVVFVISNTNHAKDMHDRSGSGIGLENLRKRLALLYPHHSDLKITETPEDFNCTLTVQL